MTLFANLPTQPVPPPAFTLNFYELVPILLNDYPEWTEDDVVDFIEEKTRARIHPEDMQTLRAVYQRCIRLESEFRG